MTEDTVEHRIGRRIEFYGSFKPADYEPFTIRIKGSVIVQNEFTQDLVLAREFSFGKGKRWLIYEFLTGTVVFVGGSIESGDKVVERGLSILKNRRQDNLNHILENHEPINHKDDDSMIRRFQLRSDQDYKTITEPERKIKN